MLRLQQMTSVQPACVVADGVCTADAPCSSFERFAECPSLRCEAIEGTFVKCREKNAAPPTCGEYEQIYCDASTYTVEGNGCKWDSGVDTCAECPSISCNFGCERQDTDRDGCVDTCVCP